LVICSHCRPDYKPDAEDLAEAKRFLTSSEDYELSLINLLKGEPRPVVRARDAKALANLGVLSQRGMLMDIRYDWEQAVREIRSKSVAGTHSSEDILRQLMQDAFTQRKNTACVVAIDGEQVAVACSVNLKDNVLEYSASVAPVSPSENLRSFNRRAGHLHLGR
jgi:hypothetical protein